MLVGSLFSGIGGFDLGLEWTGMEIAWQVENDPYCLKVLEKHWPDVPKFGDIKELDFEKLSPVDIVAGGDPCPSRSRARSNGPSKHPDLSGYFLAVAGRLRPQWVVRENVCAPDDVHFSAGLELLGYRTVIIRAEAASFTGQSRIRDFVIGCNQKKCFKKFISFFKNGPGTSQKKLDTRQVIACLTTHRTRYDSRDNYIWHAEEQKLRILDSEEREVFAGFPCGWTFGFSETTRARLLGNAVVPQVVYEIGRAIIIAEAMRG